MYESVSLSAAPTTVFVACLWRFVAPRFNKEKDIRAERSRARPNRTLCHAKNPHEGETSRGRNEVELEGVEPSSAQGNHTLSTRLSRPSFSCCDKTRATNRNLIL